MTFTAIVTLSFIVIAIVFDLIVLLVKGSDNTISAVVFNLSKQYPIIPFVAGVIAGHLWWPIA